MSSVTQIEKPVYVHKGGHVNCRLVNHAHSGLHTAGCVHHTGALCGRVHHTAGGVSYGRRVLPAMCIAIRRTMHTATDHGIVHRMAIHTACLVHSVSQLKIVQHFCCRIFTLNCN